MKFVIAMRESKTIWEFPTEKDRQGFIDRLDKDTEYATTEIKDEKENK